MGRKVVEEGSKKIGWEPGREGIAKSGLPEMLSAFKALFQ